MAQNQSLEIVTRREILGLVAVGAAIGVIGVALVALGLLPMRAGLAGTLLLFIIVFFGHLQWRYGPLRSAVRRIDSEDFEGALELLESYLASSTDRAGRPRQLAQVLKASCLFYLELYDAAIELSSDVLKNADCESLRFFAQNNLVSCYICQSKPLKANSERSKILTMGVTNDAKREALINIGLCYMNAEFFREAVETWDEALKLFPDDEQKAYVLGFQAACYNRIRSYDSALERVAEARALGPRAALTRAILLDNNAFALANKKERLDEALSMVHEAFSLKIPAAGPHLHMTSGEVHYARGEFDEALAELRAAIDRIAPRDKNSHQKAYLTLGKILQAQGKPDEAREALNKAISIDPTKTLAVHAQQVLRDPGTYNTAVSKPGQVLKT